VKVEESPYNWKGAPVVEPGKPSGERPAVVDLFCGAGGLSCGFRQAGFEVALGVDHHIPSLRTFRTNHARAATILGDIREVSDSTLLSAVRGWRVSIVAAGVPCQGFSLQNRKRYDYDERNFLFWEFIRCIELLQPPYVLLENVTGLRSAAGGRFAKDIVREIARVGYKVNWRILNAADYGVPQLRERMIFLGAHPELPLRWPPATHGQGRSPYVTVWQAISDLPPLRCGETSTQYTTQPQTDYQRLMRHGWAGPLMNHDAPRQTASTIGRIAGTRPGEPLYESYPQRVRLPLDEPSPTQVAGGIRPQFFFGHPTQARGLTVREMCRLQSIPDSYWIAGGIVQGRHQVGNSVPPLLAEAIAREISRGLADEPRAGVRQLA